MSIKNKEKNQKVTFFPVTSFNIEKKKKKSDYFLIFSMKPYARKHKGEIIHPLLIYPWLFIRIFSSTFCRPCLRKADLAGGVFFGIHVAAGMPACRDQDNDLVSLSDTLTFSDLFSITQQSPKASWRYCIWLNFESITRFILFPKVNKNVHLLP